MFKKSFALILCIAAPLTATIFHEIDTTQPLHCTLSWRHHNRIAFDCGRIKKVICPEGLLSLRLEQESGQVFISAISAEPPEVALSVITDTGQVQDFQIAFADKPCEVVILKDPIERQNQAILRANEERQTKEIARDIQALLSGKAPEGYTLCHIRSGPWKQSNGITIQPKARLEGPHYTLFLFSVKNHSFRRKPIRECDLAQPGCSWVYLTKPAIKSREEALAIVAFKKS